MQSKHKLNNSNNKHFDTERITSIIQTITGNTSFPSVVTSDTTFLLFLNTR